MSATQWIWRSAHHRVEENGDLRIFVGLASEGEDHPENAADIEAHIVAAASELPGRGQLRRWAKLIAAFPDVTQKQLFDTSHLGDGLGRGRVVSLRDRGACGDRDGLPVAAMRRCRRANCATPTSRSSYERCQKL